MKPIAPFIVLTHPRSGSTLLIKALAQHPEVRAHYEILTSSEDEATRRREGVVAGRWLSDNEDGADFLRHVFTRHHDEVAAGFKLMHHHAAEPPASSAWDFLRDHSEVRVIHLWREDLLRCVVSGDVVERTGVFNAEAPENVPAEPEPFAIQPANCRAYFEELLAWRDQVKPSFGHHPLLEVEYHRDLEMDFQATLDRVFTFLGVRPIPVQPGYVKLARRPPEEQLSNYNELAAAFAGTRFERFFESGRRQP